MQTHLQSFSGLVVCVFSFYITEVNLISKQPPSWRVFLNNSKVTEKINNIWRTPI